MTRDAVEPTRNISIGGNGSVWVGFLSMTELQSM